MTTTATQTNEAQFDDFDIELKAAGLEGIWVRGTPEEDARTYAADPHPQIAPFLWKWDAIRGMLMKAASQHGLEGMADRRVIRMINPAVKDNKVRRNRATTNTMTMTAQLLKPGEVAPSHRHNFAAFRFVVEGSGAYTVVDGEKITMSPGDLILTPPNCWHGHGNDAEPIIWLDGLDNPLVHLLQTTTWEPYPDGVQSISHDIASGGSRLGYTRPVSGVEEKLRGPLCYKWEDTYAALQRYSGSPGNPYDGVALEFYNPIFNGPTFKTMSCWIQMLRAGEKTKTHRHRHAAVYHAFRGEGTTIIDGESYHWKQGDCFVVPLWSWHSHENRSKSDEAILFSMNDMPTMQALGLWKEEAQL